MKKKTGAHLIFLRADAQNETNKNIQKIDNKKWQNFRIQFLRNHPSDFHPTLNVNGQKPSYGGNEFVITSTNGVGMGVAVSSILLFVRAPRVRQHRVWQNEKAFPSFL